MIGKVVDVQPSAVQPLAVLPPFADVGADGTVEGSVDGASQIVELAPVVEPVVECTFECVGELDVAVDRRYHRPQGVLWISTWSVHLEPVGAVVEGAVVVEGGAVVVVEDGAAVEWLVVGTVPQFLLPRQDPFGTFDAVASTEPVSFAEHFPGIPYGAVE